MKQILASLLITYTITNGQQIPEIPPQPPVDIPIPALINIAAQTPAPNTPAPITPAPVATQSVTPAPITPAPTTTSAPYTIATAGSGVANNPPQGTPAPITPAPGTTQPVTPANNPPAVTGAAPGPSPATTLSSPAVITPAPITPAPVTPVPTTPAPTTPAPTTPFPTTPAPTTNPYCSPALAAMAAQSLLTSVGQGLATCTSYTGPESIAQDAMGQLECVDGGCCMCSEISCGLNPGMPCDRIQFEDFAAMGNQNIRVKGSLAFSVPGFNQGAQITCGGQQSCRSSLIVGELVGEMQCTGVFGCNDATIILNDPAPGFSLQCEAEGGCAGTTVEINIRDCASFVELGNFQFNGPMAASGATVTVNNYCPNPVIIENLDCGQQGACQGTGFRFNGAVQIQNCDIFGATTLPPQCNGAGFSGFQQQFPPQGFPQFPQPGFPQQPMPGFPQQPFPQFPQQPFPQYPNPGFPQQPGFGAPQPFPPAPAPIDPLAPPPANPAPQIPQGPFPVNPVTPPAPVDPLAPPQTGVLPGAPAPPQPAIPAPGTPQQPGFGQPAVPAPGAPQQPGFGMPGMGFGAITGLGGNCEFPGQCTGPQTVILQSNRFELTCAEMNSCGGLGLTLNVPAGGAIDTIEAFRFEAPLAANGATITINSAGGFFANPIEISRIICEVGQSCSGLTISAPGADLSSLQVECREPGACVGGNINGISFDMLASGNFQGGGLPMMGQFPQTPQTPQQPGFGAPQQQPLPGFGTPQVPPNPGSFTGFPQQPQQAFPGFGFPQMQQPQQPGFGAPQYPPMGYPYYPQI